MLGFSSSGVTEMVSLARVGLSFSTEVVGMWKFSCCVEVRVEPQTTRRGDRIRTCDLPLPKRALYQAELRPESLTQLVRFICYGTPKHGEVRMDPRKSTARARSPTRQGRPADG